jgi:D-alanyl-D-alanine carboxypeptidase/D-alanyl-D-alanine-endopeptidase (penicillin-binding protein 4)
MMRRLLGVLLMLAPLAAAGELPPAVRDALARAGVPERAVSALVQGVDGGAPIVSHQATAVVNPASVMKLITSFAALELLGPAFTFHTDVLAAGEIANGVLDGDLVIRGGGDPKLTYERLWQLAHQLRSKGLREIRGDVIVDRGYFAPARHDPARFDSDPRRAYNVGPDAFLVNFHALAFRFFPEGDAVRVTAEPDLPNVEIASRIRLTKEPCGWWRGNLKQEISENGLLATVVFSGTYPAACGENEWALSILDSAGFAEAVLRWVWSESGGVLRGRVRSGSVPATARLIHRQESEPLANLVRDMNKYSNNVMARHVFLALSAERGAPGDAQASERIVRDWLRSRDIVAPELAIENGAGLSRNDRVSAATLAAVLMSAWSSAVMPELVGSLPILGTDGTLKTRRVALATGQAHIKGGTLTGVQSAAGYVLDRAGRRWIVVMIANHPNANAAQPALDALVEWVQKRDARGEKRGAK